MKISVITPSFNQGRFIERTVRSVLAQSGAFDLEYIVVDGGSTDETPVRVQPYANRLTWISERDEGQSDAINKGLRLATGDLLAWLNSDDTYHPGALAAVAAAYQSAPFAWCFGNCRIVDEEDREIRRAITRYKAAQSHRYSYRRLLRRDFISQPATFFSRAAYAATGEIARDLYYSMDYDYWLRLGRRWPPLYLDRDLANFRWHTRSKNGAMYRRAAWETYQTARRHATPEQRLDLAWHFLHVLTLSVETASSDPETTVRIGINTLFLIPGEVGGSETYLREVLPACLRVAPDCTLVLFTNRENDALWRETFARHAAVEFRPLAFAATRRVARIVREQTQLVWQARAAALDLLWSPGYTAPCCAPGPQVVSILDMQYREFPEDLAPVARWTTRCLVPWAARRSARVLTLSEFAKGQIVKYTGLAPDRVCVTPLAADEAFGQPLDAGACQARLASRLPFEGPYLLCVANTYPHKNVHALVEAYQRLAGETDLPLVLVGGPGRGEARMQEALRRLARPDRVLRLNHLTRAELIALYQGAALFVFPSLYESFGLPVLEAMLAGTPVIATRTGFVADAGRDAVEITDGTPDDLAAALRRLLALTAAERARRVERARRLAGAFTWTRTAEATLRCFREVVAEFRRPAGPARGGA